MTTTTSAQSTRPNALQSKAIRRADRWLTPLAVHEAAHAVVGTVYGAEVDRATIADDGSSGCCQFTGASFGVTPTRYRAHIAAAGAVAAAMLGYGPRPRLVQVDALLSPGDKEELRLAAVANGLPISSPLMAVQPLIRHCWHSIACLASDLVVKREIRHQDVYAAMGLPLDPDQAGLQLGEIRSRSAPRDGLSVAKETY